MERPEPKYAKRLEIKRIEKSFRDYCGRINEDILIYKESITKRIDYFERKLGQLENTMREFLRK